MKVLVSTSAVANPFLAADGHVDLTAVSRLAAKIETANKAVLKDAPKPPKNATPIYYSRKPLVKYSASLDKKGDHKYLALRAQQIKPRTRMPTAGSSVKMAILLPAALTGVDAVLLKSIKQAETAINRHNTKAIKVTDKVKVEKTKIRDAAAKDFDANVDVVTANLIAGGIKATNIAVGQSMFGKMVYVKLANGGVVSIGKADVTKFNAAKKAGASAVAEEPAAPVKRTTRKPAAAPAPVKRAPRKTA
jgi:hypothetical protein